MEEEKIVKLTGEPVSEQMKDVLERLSTGQGVENEEIEATKEMKMARSNIAPEFDTSLLMNREELQYNIFRQLYGMGSANIDDSGKAQYNGDIALEKRLDIVIGLPASGKSSAIVDVLSEEFRSRVIDNDEAKKLIPQYNDGWGAGAVHKESQSISYSLFTKSVFSGENIVLPKVGSDAKKLNNDYIAVAKENGYQVNVHYVDLDRNKALGRMLNRFIEDGRFLDPNLIEKYAPLGRENHITQAYEELKENPLVDGYSMWDNDVERGERPILLECDNLTGNFIDNARTEREENNYGERENFAAVDGRDNGRSGRGNQQASGIRFGTSGGIKENVGGGVFQNNDERTEIMTDDFSKAYTQFLVETLGEDGERIAQNDLEERNPDLMKHRLNEMLDVIGGEDSSYITDDIQATVGRLNQQIDQLDNAHNIINHLYEELKTEEKNNTLKKENIIPRIQEYLKSDFGIMSKEDFMLSPENVPYFKIKVAGSDEFTPIYSLEKREDGLYYKYVDIPLPDQPLEELLDDNTILLNEDMLRSYYEPFSSEDIVAISCNNEELVLTQSENYSIENITQNIDFLKQRFIQETKEDITDWKIGQISNEELNNMLASGQTQELEFSINELREAGISSGLDTLRLNTLDSIRTLGDIALVRSEEISEPKWNIVHEMDDDNGNPTEWSTQINDSYIWIDKTDNGFEVHDTPNPSDRPLETLSSLDEAKEWVAEEYISDTKEIVDAREGVYMENNKERFRALAKDIFDKTYLTLDLPEEQEDALMNTSEFVIEDIYNDLTTGKIAKQLNNVNETISAYHASLEKLPSEDNSLREVYKEKIKEVEELFVELKNLDTEKDIVVIDNKECVKVDEWQTSMGTIVLGNDISDPTDKNFYLAQIGTVNAEFYGKPTREEVEDYFINELGQIEHDMKEKGMNEVEREEAISDLTSQLDKIDGLLILQDINNPDNRDNILSQRDITDLSQIETKYMTAMEKELLTFDITYNNANGQMPLNEVNDCIMTNNTENLYVYIQNEFSNDEEMRYHMRSLVNDSATFIEDMRYDRKLTTKEQHNFIITSLDMDKFSESMDSRLNNILDTYGSNDVADDITLVTTVGTTKLSHVDGGRNGDDFNFRDDDSDLVYTFNGYDIVEVKSEDYELFVKNEPLKKPICYNDNITVSDLSGENALLMRYGSVKQGFDLAVWHKEDGIGQFAIADAGCLDSFHSEHSNGNILVMGELPSLYEKMNPKTVANRLMNAYIGDSLYSDNYKVMYLGDKSEDISIPKNDPVKLPFQAEYSTDDESHTVYFFDEATAENFSEYIDYDFYMDVNIDVRSMTETERDKIMEYARESYAFGTDDHCYISFVADKEKQTVTATKYDHDLTPVVQEKVTFANRDDFAVEVGNFSPLQFISKNLDSSAFENINSLSWVNTEQFMSDVSEHENTVREAVQKFDSLESSARYDVTFRYEDGSKAADTSIDSIDDLNIYIAPRTGTFEIREAGNLIVKGDIDDNMRDIIAEAISEDTDSVFFDKEREALELDRPVSEQAIAHTISEILYAHSDKDITLDEIELDIMQQIENAKADPEKLDSIIVQLDKIYENDHPTLEESVKIYSCEERLNSLKDEKQTKEQERNIESRERDKPAKAENSFQSVGEILKAGLPQAEADIEIAILLKEQGRADDFIQSVQLMSHCQPDIAMQIADAGMITIQEKNQQKGFPQQDDLITKQQNPLNKVEELLEGNYNQIDGVINNLPPQTNKEEIKPSLKEVVEHKKDIIKERSQFDREEKEQTTEKSVKNHTQEL